MVPREKSYKKRGTTIKNGEGMLWVFLKYLIQRKLRIQKGKSTTEKIEFLYIVSGTYLCPDAKRNWCFDPKRADARMAPKICAQRHLAICRFCCFYHISKCRCQTRQYRYSHLERFILDNHPFFFGQCRGKKLYSGTSGPTALLLYGCFS